MLTARRSRRWISIQTPDRSGLPRVSPMPNDPAGTNLDAGLFQMADRRQAVVRRCGWCRFAEKAARTFEVMAVATRRRLLSRSATRWLLMMPSETSGRVLPPAFNSRTRAANISSIGPSLRPFQRRPADGRHAFRLASSRLRHGFGSTKPYLASRSGNRRLRAKTAFSGQAPALALDDGAEMDFVTLEFPRMRFAHESKSKMSAGFKLENAPGLIAVIWPPFKTRCPISAMRVCGLRQACACHG